MRQVAGSKAVDSADFFHQGYNTMKFLPHRGLSGFRIVSL